MTSVFSLTYNNNGYKNLMLKPMLAGTIEPDFDLNKLNYPFLVSPKLDGIRATVQNSLLVSRNLKLIRNQYTQKRFGCSGLENLDGELIFGSPTASDVYHQTNSAVMSADGSPNVSFYVFDFLNSPASFEKRIKNLIMSKAFPNVITVIHTLVHDADELLGIEDQYLKQGYEGVMLRDPKGPYKHGRSTFSQGWLLKLKRFKDSEAIILGMEEEMQNTNEGIRNEVGKLKRSSHKANMVPKGSMGTLQVRDIHTDVEFYCGGGFTAEQRQDFWKNQSKYIGRVIKYKYFPIGVKDKPRHPGFLGFRDPSDL